MNDVPSLLLVEDSEDDAFFFQRVLRKACPDCQLDHASNGAAAVDFILKAATHSSGSRLPDWIFLDLKMPVLSGFDVLAWLKRQAFDHMPPVIVLSGSDHTEDKMRALELGASDYLVKPIRTEGLLEILNKFKSRSSRAIAGNRSDSHT